MEQKDTKQKLVMEDVPQNTKDTVKRLMERLGRQKGRLVIVVLMTLLSSGAYASIPLVVGMALDKLLGILKLGAAGAEIPSLIAGALGLPVLLLVLASMASALLSYVQQYIVASVGETLALSLRQDVSAKLSRLPLRYFDTHQAGDIMSRVTSDVEKVSTVIQTGLMQFISAGFTIMFTFGAMLLLSPSLFLVTLAAIAACGGATFFVSGWSQRSYAKSMAAMGELGAKVEEVYSGNRVVKVFSLQEMVIGEMTALNQKQFEANRQAQFADYAIYPSIRFINQLGFVVVAVVSGGAAISGVMTLGAAQAFLQYYNQVSEPITQLSYVITSTQAAIAGAERVFVLLDQEEEPADASEEAAPMTEGHVSFQNVRFGYTPQKILMKDLSLEVKPNEMVAIVGPTGGGKSTLINLLMRFYDLNGGSISIDGQDISQIPRHALRREIGMVLQDTWLFEGTIAENLSYGKMDATRDEIEAAAKAACCDHFIRTLPEGYDTIISGEASHLSQGQMQLLTIARAMLTNPSILILDEATSSVDTRTEVEIQKAMTRLMKDKTSFVIAHRLSTIRNADMILVVRDGDIVERGNHESLLDQNGFYASLYYSQFEQAG